MHEKSEKSENQSMASKAFVTACIILIVLFATFDSSAIDGLVPLLQEYFNIQDAQTASIRTASSITHTVTLALCWLFGDAFDRRKFYLTSVTLWIVLSLLSIVLGSQSYLLLVIFRALAEVASTMFGVFVPVMFADLFEDRGLGIALMCVSCSTLIAAQFTAILNSWIVTSGVAWQVGLLPGPVLTIVPLIGIVFMSGKLIKGSKSYEKRSIAGTVTNAFGLFSIKSFVLLVAASALVQFYKRAFGFWFPTMVLDAWTAEPEAFYGNSYTTITTFISIAKLAGNLTGLPLFLWFAQSWRHGTGPFSGRKGYNRAYPIVVSVGAFLNAFMLIFVFLLVIKSYLLFLASLFIAFLGAFVPSTMNQQMTMMVVPTKSRPAAMALFALVTGLVSTPSAQLFGMISDAYRGDSTLPYDKFQSYQFALLCSLVFNFAGALSNTILIAFFPGDCKRAEEERDKEEQGSADEQTSLIGSPKSRSESLLETFTRSRAQTENSTL